MGASEREAEATRSMPVHWNDTASEYVRYTRSKDNSTIYAIALTSLKDAKPLSETLTLACVTPDTGSKIWMYGNNATSMPWSVVGGKLQIKVGALPPAMCGKPGYAFKITGQPTAKC